jgi:hypothetical protein
VTTRIAHITTSRRLGGHKFGHTLSRAPQIIRESLLPNLQSLPWAEGSPVRIDRSTTVAMKTRAIRELMDIRGLSTRRYGPFLRSDLPDAVGEDKANMIR